MADTKILIVVKDPEAGKAYGEALSEIGVEYDIAPSFEKMSQMVVDAPYNGLIVDILTLVRSRNDEKVIAYDCINLYPVLRVKWEPKQKQIKVSPLDGALAPDGSPSSLESFIESRCRPFPPRQLRRHKRKQLSVNLLLGTDDTFSEESTLKTFAVTISAGGVFVHTTRHFEKGMTLWLRFPEFADQAPIPATVRWCLDWGCSRRIPGIGLRFERFSLDQEQEIRRLSSL
jgi:Tfp pilus assembly protein PilZ